ncbi:hypothetical protein QYF36_022260 [Acer negundo]|nr:hypothetical protein QYF36_022260 [Acer negundo]
MRCLRQNLWWKKYGKPLMDVMEFYKDESIVKDVNYTFIALMPKVKRPTTMGDFRPISLVGLIYKILAKILTNRIKRVMNTAIGDFQMAFIEGRKILDSFVIAEEIINKWKRENEGGVAIKLDFEKAYDSIDHRFLDDVLSCMGFGVKWRGWIKKCVSSPMLSVLVNGNLTPQFGIQRVLRQRDPLSPFLFNITAEVLSHLFIKATKFGLF